MNGRSGVTVSELNLMIAEAIRKELEPSGLYNSELDLGKKPGSVSIADTAHIEKLLEYKP